MASPEGGSACMVAGTLVAGRYRIEQPLARGGMGEVYSAFDEATQRRVALKRMLPLAAADRSASLSFVREYQLLAQLRHPRIIEVYEYGTDSVGPYYSMELLTGQDLGDVAPLDAQPACLHLRDVATSLTLLHARRLVHRDLSPRNVRCGARGRCKLLDFGTVAAFGVPPNIAGTPPIVAPEALRGAAIDPRADLYSLGALAYYVLTGRHAYPATSFELLWQLHAAPVVRPSKLASVPKALEELVMSLLAFDPRNRPGSAAEVIERLNAIGELPADDLPTVANSFIVSSRLVGREREDAQVTELLERALTGAGGALLITGEAGIGRSRLLSDAVASAQRRGFTTLHAVAHGPRGTETLSATLVQALSRAAPEHSARSAKSRAPAKADLTRWSAARAPTGEARARLQVSLTAHFCGVARLTPLLVAVDDVERADDFSAAWLAALAFEARRLPLVIITTRHSDAVEAPFSALETLRKSSGRLELQALDALQTAELVTAMFGEVPNSARLADWLNRATRGNPAMTLELVQHLRARGVIRYFEGTWALPSDEITEPIPASLRQSLELRLLRLLPVARMLAELMSVRRGGLTVLLAVSAASAPAHEVVLAFDELVREGVVEVAREEYVFVQQAMRDAVRSGLTPQRETELHAALARALLATSANSDDAQLEAGWHLVHTQDRLRGAALLAQVGPRLMQEGCHISSAMPALEKALAVYETHGGQLAERLRLRSQLVLAGYLFDYRLGFRYGMETLSQLYPITGLGLHRRIHRWLPRPLAFLCAAAWTELTRHFVRRGTPQPIAAIKYFGRTLLALMGLRATALDGSGTAQLLELSGQLSLGFPHPFGAEAVRLAARAFALQPLGREAELHDAVKLALEALETGRSLFMTESEHQELLAGLLLIDGINECYREHSRALDRARSLDALGSQLSAACAHRIRMIYAVVRGDRELAERERNALDLIAIQGGTTWQVEWFAAPVEGLAAAAFEDLIATRRALDKLDVLLEHVPSLEPLRDAVRISYCYQRGQYARAVELGEAFVAEHAPRSVIGWGPTYAIIAISLTYAEQPARALELTERALGALTDRDHEYFVMYAPLIGAKAWAIASLGDPKAALELLAGVVSRLTLAREYRWLAMLYEHQARIATQIRDLDTLRAAIAQLQHTAVVANDTSLVARALHWEQRYERLQASPIPPRARRSEPAASLTREETPRTMTIQHEAPRPPHESSTAVATFLGSAARMKRHRRALQVLARAAGSRDAHLYVRRPGRASCVASFGAMTAPAKLSERLSQLMAAAQDAPEASVIELPADSTAAPHEPMRYHVVWLGAADSRNVAAALGEGSERLSAVSRHLIDELTEALCSAEAAHSVPPDESETTLTK